MDILHHEGFYMSGLVPTQDFLWMGGRCCTDLRMGVLQDVDLLLYNPTILITGHMVYALHFLQVFMASMLEVVFWVRFRMSPNQEMHQVSLDTRCSTPLF